MPKAATTRSEPARRDCDVGCASATSSPTLTAEQVNNCQTLVAASKACAAMRANVEAVREPRPASELEAQVRERPLARGEHLQGCASEASPIAELTYDRPGDSSAGQLAVSEPLPAIGTLPTEAALSELGLQMLTGGSGAPAAPAEHYEPAEATLELLVLVWSVVATLKKERADAFHMVPGTNGRIDAEESRGFLLGAVLGRGLLAREQAAAAGCDARNKKKALEKRIADDRETARKAARKLSGDAREQHAADAANARAALERAPLPLSLPPPLPPPKPPSAAGRKRTEPPPPGPLQHRFEAWCRRHDPGGVADPVEYYEHQRKYARLSRAMTARRWKPRTWAERRDRAQTLTRQQRSNQLCECDDDVPSILCRAHACYAFEIGMCDGLPEPGRVARDPASRISCNCMRHAWGVDQEQRWPAHKPPLMIEATEDYDFLTEQTTRFLYFSWLDPMPGGQYGPDFDPEAAARKLTTMDMHPTASERYGFNRENFPSFGKV